MLTGIHLKNYILIDELKLSLNSGMSVITGETGAGKSIIVGALNLVFGKSGSQQIAYDPQKDVYLEMTFSAPSVLAEVHAFLEETGFPAENEEIIVSREFTAAGKTTSYLNGRRTSSAVLKDLHDLLIDFHHQRDQQKLLNPGYQLDLLDLYGGLLPLRNEFRNCFQELRSTMKALKEMQEAELNNQQLIDLYRFQLEELDSAGLVPGEDKELEQEFELLTHSEDIINIASQTYAVFYEQENSLYDTVTQALNQIQKYSAMSSSIREISSKLEACSENIQEASIQLRDLKEQIDIDPERLNGIRQRLDLINTFKTKYKQASIEEILAYKSKIEQSVLSQDNRNEEIQALTDRINVLFSVLLAKADHLTDRRRASSQKLAADIKDNVKKLSIQNAQFEIQIDKKADGKILLSDIAVYFSDNGQDVAEFRFSANPGSPVLPLKSIASGGELSRILLATKKALSGVMPPRTIILDEIESGIGGKTAGSLAEFIHDLSGSYQVICITHLAKIAAAADNHIAIEKKTQKGATSVDVDILDTQKRIKEIARMLSGHITELSLQHARELLNIKIEVL
jgi:DNA repair protein RecN (Recombination protein N)